MKQDKMITVFDNMMSTEGRNVSITELISIVEGKESSSIVKKSIHEKKTQEAREAYESGNSMRYDLVKQQLPVWLPNAYSINCTKRANDEYTYNNILYIDIDSKDNPKWNISELFDYCFNAIDKHILFMYPSLNAKGIHCFISVNIKNQAQYEAAHEYARQIFSDAGIIIDKKTKNVNRCAVIPFPQSNEYVYVNEDVRMKYLNYEKIELKSKKNVSRKYVANARVFTNEVKASSTKVVDDFLTCVENTLKGEKINEKSERYMNYNERIRFAYTLQCIYGVIGEDYFVRFWNLFLSSKKLSESQLRAKYRTFEFSNAARNYNDYSIAMQYMIQTQKKLGFVISSDIRKEKIEIEEKIYNDLNCVNKIKKAIIENQEVHIDAKTGSGKTYSIVNIFRELSSEDVYNDDYENQAQLFNDEDRRYMKLENFDGVTVIVTPNSALAQQISQNYNIACLVGQTDESDVYDAIASGMVVTNITKFTRLFGRGSGFKLRAVVIDEAHSLVNHSSADFKSDTIENFLNIIEREKTSSKNFKLVSMSGTTHDMHVKIRGAYYIEILQRKHQVFDVSHTRYTDVSDIAHYIFTTHRASVVENRNDNKFIVYINSTSEVKKIKKILCENFNYRTDEVVYISAEVKNYNNENENKIAYNSIVENEIIPDNVSVVITTSLLSEGVNIMNDNIQEIIYIDDSITYDTYDVIQCISRARSIENVKARIFFKNSRYEKDKEIKKNEYTKYKIHEYIVLASILMNFRGINKSVILTDEGVNVTKDGKIQVENVMNSIMSAYHRSASASHLISDIENCDYRVKINNDSEYIEYYEDDIEAEYFELAMKKTVKEFCTDEKEAINVHKNLMKNSGIIRYINAYSYAANQTNERDTILKDNEKLDATEVQDEIETLNMTKPVLKVNYFMGVIMRLYEVMFTLSEIEAIITCDGMKKSEILNILEKKLSRVIFYINEKRKRNTNTNINNDMFSNGYFLKLLSEYNIIDNVEMKQYDSYRIMLDELHQKGVRVEGGNDTVKIKNLNSIIMKNFHVQKLKRYYVRVDGRRVAVRPFQLVRRVNIDDINNDFKNCININDYIERVIHVYESNEDKSVLEYLFS